MGASSIPVDLFNPGQVLACLGLMEASIHLLGECRACFDWSQPGRERFHLECIEEAEPVPVVLEFLLNCEVRALAPFESVLDTSAWDVACHRVIGSGYPFAAPASPATLVAEMTYGDKRIVVDYWGDSSSRDNFKLWAGAAGYPGAGLLRDALQLLHEDPDGFRRAPFEFTKLQSSSFRLDWRRDYVPIDAGFSPNKHASVKTVGYPGVEVLAAVGLGHARPLRLRRWDKLHYRYGIVGRDRESKPLEESLLDPIFLRAALGGSVLPFPGRRFDMQLSWPGKEGQARSINQVTEVTENVPDEY